LWRGRRLDRRGLNGAARARVEQLGRLALIVGAQMLGCPAEPHERQSSSRAGPQRPAAAAQARQSQTVTDERTVAVQPSG
jgi:hypothetical protein